jgi:hypothetical protein
MRKVILNPVTGLPLTRAKIYKYFRREMDEGVPSLKFLVAERFMAHLREGREYAVRLGMKNKHGWATDGAAPPPAYVLDVAQDQEPLKISFVLPSKPPESPPVIDAVPTGRPTMICQRSSHRGHGGGRRRHRAWSPS